MLATLIPNFDEEIAKIHEIGRSGVFMVFGFSFFGPEHVYQNYPKEWSELYQKRNYYFADPVFAWSLSYTGRKRWSDLKMHDMRNVMKDSKQFGLKYGASFSKKNGLTQSFLSVARPDRELTDVEMEFIDAKFCTWVQLVMEKPRLTDAELDVLRCLRDGFSQSEIAEILQISESTVKQRAIKSCKKLNARTRTQAVAIAVARNYLTTEYGQQSKLAVQLSK
ncbi:helix-turn-helix transcriptional regulator [Parasulfitobacter algicola]|uniref:LuxR family transcriptional regulator n=1 Tax=Parasulfitobacter algicola TaxID=2614809 RepID=A0ABX2INT8_9RHOB|nr:LuxR family transcriptional regulator [Sulfitobacter algicola]NSX54559.1 LuxR family transcriptional regulator [Sulfitobacter algicola]